MIDKNGKELALSLGADSIMVEKDLSDIQLFLEELYNISINHPVTQMDWVKQKLKQPLPPSTSMTVKQNMMSIKELSESYYADVDWVTLISSLMFSSKSKTVITEDQMIVTNPTYITKFKDLMEKTSSKTVANVMGFNIMLNTYSPNGNVFNIIKKADNVTLDNCAKFLSTATIFYNAAEALYVREYFSQEQKNKTEDIFNITVTEMKLLLRDLEWMDETTKTKAIQKADAILSKMGYNHEVLSETKMSSYHDSFLESMNSTSFVNSQVHTKLISLNRFIFDYYLWGEILVGLVKCVAPGH